MADQHSSQPLSLLSSFTQDHHGLHSKNKKTKDHIVSDLLLAQDEHNKDRVIEDPMSVRDNFLIGTKNAGQRWGQGERK